MPWRSYVAMGDSFTEGLDDPYPDGTFRAAGPEGRGGAFRAAGPEGRGGAFRAAGPEGRGGTHYRGWADLVAGRLAADTPGFHYANLAVRGKLFAPIVADQVPVGRGLRPDLFSFAAGGNDALRRTFEPARLAAALDDVARQLRADGADLLLFTFAPANLRLPGRQIFHTRARQVNPAVAEVAARHGARLVNLWADDELVNPLLWSVDRLHLNGYGHRRVAAHVLTALGVAPDADWWEVPSPGARRSWAATRVEDVRWAGQHLAPWVHRRLTGRSSGDNRLPKRPTLGPLDV